jgi:hypothetical protein
MGACERAQIVDPMRLIGVVMGDKHSVEMSDLLAQKLLSKVRGCIDKHTRYALGGETLHHRRTACATIARLGRVTIAPAVIEPRYTC